MSIIMLEHKKMEGRETVIKNESYLEILACVFLILYYSKPKK